MGLLFSGCGESKNPAKTGEKVEERVEEKAEEPKEEVVVVDNEEIFENIIIGLPHHPPSLENIAAGTFCI